MLAALLMSTLLIATHQFAFAIQQMMQDWK